MGARLLLFLPLLLFLSFSALAQQVRSDRAQGLEAVTALHFEPNVGQAGSSHAEFLARAGGHVVWLGSNYIEFPGRTPNSKAVHIEFPGANSATSIEEVDQQRMKVNYFRGARNHWRTGVPTFSAVRYRNLYPGIDLLVHPSADRVTLEYDFEVAPDADPSKIRIRYCGAKAVQLDTASGEIKLKTSIGELRQRKVVVYQESSAKRHPIEAHYVLVSSRVAAIQLGAYRQDLPLTIDPAISYSTVLGSGLQGFAAASAVATFTVSMDNHVYAYVVGSTSDSSFPTRNSLPSADTGSCSAEHCNGVAFVSKIDPSASGAASLVWSTFLGGSGGDGANAAAVDSAGNVYVAGDTCSVDFPTLNGFQNATKVNPSLQILVNGAPGCASGFLSKISSDGSTLLYSTYFGGPSGDHVNAVAVGASGRTYIGGVTNAQDIGNFSEFGCGNCGPPIGILAGFDTTQSGSNSLVYAIYVNYVSINSLAVDSSGDLHLGGSAPRGFNEGLNGYQIEPSGSSTTGAFYAVINPTSVGGVPVLYSTYLGGAGDQVVGIAVDAAGNAYLTGNNASGTIPVTTGAYSSTLCCSFAAKINPKSAGAASLVYSTYLGSAPNSGFSPMVSSSVAVDSQGDAFIGGTGGPGMQLVNPAENSSYGIYESLDAGATWSELGLAPLSSIGPTAVDSSTSPSTIFVGSGSGSVFISGDGGLTWVQSQVYQPVGHLCNQAGGSSGGSNCVDSIAVDPTTPTNVYVGTGNGVFKSADHGATWTALNNGLSLTASQNVLGLTFDGGNLYAASVGTGNANQAGVYELLAGSNTWVPLGLNQPMSAVVIDPTTTPHTLYATEEGESSSYKSTNGGQTWTFLSFAIDTLVVDTTTTPSTLYGYSLSCCSGPFFLSSTDRGNTWTGFPTASTSQYGYSGGASGNFDWLEIDTSVSPPLLYLFGEGDGIRSNDRGNTWTPIPGVLSFGNLGWIASDARHSAPGSPAVLYGAPVSPGRLGDGIVVELNPSGSSLLFSTYIGGIFGPSSLSAIALDGASNIFVAGNTASPYFPSINAFESSTTPLLNPCCFGDYRAAFLTYLGAQSLPPNSATPVTTQVAVPIGTLTVTYPNLSGSTTSGAPTLSVVPLSSATTANFQLSNNLGAFDISTTAVYSGSVTLCFQALTVNDPTTFSTLSLLHIVGGVPVDITSSHNFATRTVCGTATSFSPFILVKGVGAQIQELITAVNSLDLRKGIPASLDVKLQNAVAAFSAANAHNYANVCGMMSGFISEVQAQVGQTLTDSDAAPLISAAKQVQATVGCSQ